MSIGSEKLSNLANIALVVFLVSSAFIFFVASGTNQYNVESNTSDIETLKSLGLEVAGEGQNLGNQTTNIDQDPEAKGDIEGSIFLRTITGAIDFVTSMANVFINMATTIIGMLPLGGLTNPLIVAASAAVLFFIMFRVVIPLVLRT